VPGSVTARPCTREPPATSVSGPSQPSLINAAVPPASLTQTAPQVRAATRRMVTAMAKTGSEAGSGTHGRRVAMGGGALALTLVTAALTASERTSGPATEQAAAAAIATVGGGTAARIVAGPSGGYLVSVLTSAGQWAHVIEDAAFTVRALRVERLERDV
jgi:hypothetical protein